MMLEMLRLVLLHAGRDTAAPGNLGRRRNSKEEDTNFNLEWGRRHAVLPNILAGLHKRTRIDSTPSE